MLDIFNKDILLSEQKETPQYNQLLVCLKQLIPLLTELRTKGKKQNRLLHEVSIKDSTETLQEEPYEGLLPSNVYVKSCYVQEGHSVSMGSKFPPFTSNYTSTVVRTLEKHKINITPVTLMPFCVGSLSLQKHEDGRWVGGSSTGCAKALELQKDGFAVGSDTGGSSRLPAAQCNLIGYKPSFGKISRYGLVPLCSQLDTVGLMGTSVKNVKTLYNLLKGYDPKDCFTKENINSTSLKKPTVNCIKNITKAGLSPQYLEPIYFFFCCVDFLSNMARFNGLHHINQDTELWSRFNLQKMTDLRDLFEPLVKARIRAGLWLLEQGLGNDYHEDRELLLSYLTEIRLTLNNHYWKLPVAPNYDPYSKNIDSCWLVLANLINHPCIMLSGLDQQPFQIMGPRNSDLELLELAENMQQKCIN